MGGHEAVRKLWRDYFMEVDAVLFMIDSAERSRFCEAKEELQGLLTDSSLQNIPIGILANKMELPVCFT